jgi:hypothetical protein
MFPLFHALIVKGNVFKNNLDGFQINYQKTFLHTFKFK